MALAAALVIGALGITSEFVAAALYMFTPTVAALIMLLVVTRDGFFREGWKSLGLHRSGLGVWWIAIGAPLLVSVVATAIVWATSLASFVLPEIGLGGHPEWTVVIHLKDERCVGLVIEVDDPPASATAIQGALSEG